MKNEINRRWLAAFLSVLFLLAAYKCSSQIIRYKTDTSVVITPKNAMRFDMGKQDTTYVSIYADSSSAGYKFIMAVSYPNWFEIDGSSIYIGHQYGANEAFLPNRLDSSTNTADFILTAAQVEFLKSSPFTLIAFNDRYSDRYCTDVKMKRYFMQFLTEYKK